MSDYLYFLSYARPDGDNDKHGCIRTFHEELEQKVRMLTGSVQGSVGFFDGEGVEPGDVWPDALAEALCTSRVFVPIYSPTYFTKDYCGREWKIFRDRLNAYKRQNPAAKVESLIQPILLVSPRELRALPDSISDIQYLYDQYPEEYRTEGLDVIFRVGAYKDSYEMFKTALARRIVEVAEKHPLPPLVSRPDIKQTTSAFHRADAQISAVNDVSQTVGPRYVQFIFVAAKHNELREIRKSLDYYGHEGGLDWKPFLPKVTDEVAMLATEVALKEKLRYETVPLDADIIEKLKEAEQNNKIVVIIVDTWTLHLERYCTLMRPYDDLNFLNCVVLVPWNPHDDETLLSRSMLEKKIQETFPKKWILRDPSSFLDSINSLDELKKQLSDTLRTASTRIIQKMEVVKKAESAQVIDKPTIEGPGG
jgi:FxsC-like protein